MGVVIKVTTQAFQQSGAVFMWAILVAGALAVALVLNKLYYLFVVCGKSGSAVYNETLSSLDNTTIDETIDLLSKKKAPIYKALKTVVEYKNMGLEYTKRKLSMVFLSEIPKIQSDTNLINMSANIATLLGLLGTIVGLIMAFDAVANVEASKRAEALAMGISIAMVTTAIGLMIAIPTLFFQGIIVAKSEKIIEQMDEKSTKLVNKLFN